MKIIPIKLFADGYMVQPFAFGGEEGAEKFDPTVRYRSALTNYLIDTGKEVILVDTGMPDAFPEQVPDAKTPIYMGRKVNLYMDALKEAGYTPEQVSKILVTHKHADHTGVLAQFPDAEIYASEIEAASEELQPLPNVHAVKFTDGAYDVFEKSQTIAPGIHYIFAPGHTTGTSIVIVEDGGLYYMIHGDVTYTDEALYENKLSVVFEDVKAARHTLDLVRTFVSTHPTVYVSTHTPLGYENLEARRVVDLDHMPAPLPVKEIKAKEASGKYVCSVCGFVYDPAVGDPEHGIPAGTAFEDLPDDWTCPRCKQPKEKFERA
ncbi:MAG: rubredoxin [Eubacteriales bacterium]|jgi:rubredoxin/L-ascorbate metabolism protein UlaG (beta-lactamase superfamily)|nr:rubredoxin [Eubacteriales bacterium]